MSPNEFAGETSETKKKNRHYISYALNTHPYYDSKSSKIMFSSSSDCTTYIHEVVCGDKIKHIFSVPAHLPYTIRQRLSILYV